MNEQYISANGIELAYQEFGDLDKPALILIMGLSGQMTAWPVKLCTEIATLGFRVIRFDNRDSGLSEKTALVNTPSLASVTLRSRLGLNIKAPYSLDDMADDVIGLMDALNINSAHFMGISMGGMIAQIIASNYPQKTLSLISAMSSTGEQHLPSAKAHLRLHFMRLPPIGKQATICRSVQTLKLAGGSKYPQSLSVLYEKAKKSYLRSHYPSGAVLHLMAIAASGDRVAELKSINTTTLIIHGSEDPMVPMQCGVRTAELIPQAKLEVINGLGHDLPDAVHPRLIDALASHFNRAVNH